CAREFYYYGITYFDYW
nr:immunoglobulin heavy chain junction region [Mus musculus]MBK4184187.1 immunoglobulin heavy chain junction region [Mus musculus]MBK4184188.1 immunoglobulin heavy chain junction region [Mus musculus]MBK4184189.1 immunoglobulin heavy chain junction region [Mus musculus]MBK4198185.1 immunoglobulin heavy chain junction region [Mus musculus]